MEEDQTISPPVLDTLAIRSNGIGKRYKNTEAVIDVNLTVETGSICALLGPNGAGKTTTLKMLMGIIEPTSGDATVLGTTLESLDTPSYQKIGYVSENQKMPDWMTLRQFLRFLEPYYPTWDVSLAEKLVSEFDLPLDRKLKEMSRGMRMKVKFLAAIVYHPELLVLDEPFSGLDPVTREECNDSLLHWIELGGRTAIISSHDIEDVERIADHVAIIEKGRLELSEDVDSLKNRVRKVTLSLSEATEIPPSLPSSWISAKSQHRHIEFFDTQYDQERTERLARTVFPTFEQIHQHSLTLREIYIALIKQVRRATEGKYGSETHN